MASLSRASASSSNVKKCPSSDAWARVSRARLERPPTRTTGRRRGSRAGVARCASASNTPTEALRRIEKAKETKRLDLSGLGLREIPPETYELDGLLELQVSNNNLYDVPESLLEKLTTIERLGLAGNRLRALRRRRFRRCEGVGARKLFKGDSRGIVRVREFTKFSRGWESVAGVAGKHVEIEEFRGVVGAGNQLALRI